VSEQDIEIIDNRDPSEYGSFEYHTLHGQPVRIALNKGGQRVSADMLNADTGELVRAAVIAQIDRDPSSEEISENDFYDLCKDLVLKK